MSCILALVTGLIFSLPDVLDHWNYLPVWLHESPSLYFAIRYIEAVSVAVFVVRGRCPSLLVLFGVVGPGLAFRIALQIASSSGVNNLVPVGIAFEVFSAFLAVLACFFAAYFRRSREQ